MSFNDSYQGTPPWDIGRAQKSIIKLESDGKITGKVLDVGCGTGENALYLAKKGYNVIGIDASPLAIQKAKLKQQEFQNLNLEFQEMDIFKLKSSGWEFHTIVDAGVFHVFSNSARIEYLNNIHSVLIDEGYFHLHVFSDKEPGGWGPRRISKDEIYQSFQEGWKIVSIKDTPLEMVSPRMDSVQGLLIEVRKLQKTPDN
ncbi:MAG: class I SAM-dependent methyltransferase [Candidatus Heimdallarchaeota archaeon]|nr:class I SAM-dependent methyltransferase [Candidatus Heimdallarchaeota archaeon]